VSCRPLQVVLKLFADFVAVVGRLAREKADLVMPGRTHGQQALPITFGYKCAAWIDELLRHAERLCQSADRLFRAILGGATTSSLLPWLLAACLPAGLPACSPRLRWTRRTRGGGGSRRRDTFEGPAAAPHTHRRCCLRGCVGVVRVRLAVAVAQAAPAPTPRSGRRAPSSSAPDRG
jgi:hypothetical protein